MTASQQQMMDQFAENYTKMVDSFTPENSSVREAYHLMLEQMKAYNEAMLPIAEANSPQAFMEKSMDMMRKTTELNMSYTQKYVELYQKMMGEFTWPSAN